MFLIKRIKAYFRNITRQDTVWPDIDYELIEHEKLGRLKGKVLNAGCGHRDISKLIDGDLINQDIAYENDNRKDVDIYSPIDSIPFPDNTFDSIVCIAVLEHVENPEDVLPEFFRVIKSGRYIIASIPFLQPEHKVPTDFQRYTRDGIMRLFSNQGFEVIETKSLFTVYHTLHWIAYEWLHLKNSFGYKILRVIILPSLTYLSKKSSLSSDKLATAFQIVAKKPSLD